MLVDNGGEADNKKNPPNGKMAFFKWFRSRSKSNTTTIVISKPIPSKQDEERQSSDRNNYHSSINSMDHENRRSPPTPLKLRGNYYALNTGTSLSRVPSSPLPPLPSFDAVDDLATPHSYPNTSSLGYSRGVARFERVGSESDDTMGMLSPERMPINRLSPESDGIPDVIPVSNSPPKLKLSFESNITEAGSVYDLDTPPNHRVSIKPIFKRKPAANSRQTSSPERIITNPVVTNPTNAAQTRTSITSNNTKQLRRSSAVYKRRMSLEATETSSSKSGKSTLDSPEDRDSGFHEDFDEALRSKQPSPDKQSLKGKHDISVHPRQVTGSPERISISITPERAPLIPAESRMTPITLVDPGVTKKKTVSMTLPQIEKTEKFKETFSTNLFENTAPPAKRRTLTSPKPVVPTTKGKVMTPEEFEKLRQQADDDSEDEDEEEDIARDESYQADLEKQRRRQQAALSVYRQQMTKVVGADASPKLSPQRPLSQIGETPETDDESEEIPLAILMAHGFPQTNNRPGSRSSTAQPRERSIILEPGLRTPSPGNLPVFAKNLPVDPHAMGLPRSTSAYDLRLNTRASSSPLVAGRANSTPTVPLLESYQTRQRKGALFLDPNQQAIEMSNQMMPQDQSYFNRPTSQYEIMGMQPVPGQGMIQYVPVVVTQPLASSPSLPQMQPPTLMQELYERQQIGVQQRQMTAARISQYALQYPPPPMTPQQPMMSQQAMMSQQSLVSHHPLHPTPISRPQSVYHDPRRSIYDQKSIYSSTSQQPTARPKLPSSNPAHRHSSIPNSVAPGRYRASTYGGAGLGVSQSTDRVVSPPSPDNDDDAGWESLRRKKEEMQARRMSRMQTAA